MGGEKQRADGRRRLPSQEFVLPQVHSLDDVPAVVEHPADVLRVHGTGEVWVAVVSAIAARSADPLGGTSGTEVSGDWGQESRALIFLSAPDGLHPDSRDRQNLTGHSPPKESEP